MQKIINTYVLIIGTVVVIYIGGLMLVRSHSKVPHNKAFKNNYPTYAEVVQVHDQHHGGTYKIKMPDGSYEIRKYVDIGWEVGKKFKAHVNLNNPDKFWIDFTEPFYHQHEELVHVKGEVIKKVGDQIFIKYQVEGEDYKSQQILHFAEAKSYKKGQSVILQVLEANPEIAHIKR
ncbi:hypothetical protein GYB29_10675 [bacterium]|nr:hypothetical protein [bacterium]